jgi:hypothetical protein
MSRTLGAFVILASLGCVPGAGAASSNVKCSMNEDRVWVYESVVDFNVAAKLKCGEPVEIVGRVKGYVKIQTQAGVEGYVADSAFPKSVLPPEPVEAPNDVQSASVAALSHHSAPPSIEPAHTTTIASSAATSVPASAAPATRPQPPAVAPTPAPQPVIVASASPAPAPAESPVAAAPVAPKPQPPSLAPAAKAPPVVAANVPPAAVPVAAASQPAEVEITLTTAPAVATTNPAPAPASVPTVAASAPPVTNSQPAPAPVVAPSSSTQPVAGNVANTPARTANPDEDEDTAVKALDNESAGCTHFFSAYGLSPNQYKWLAQNRKKAFPSVCPAPTPSMVDFVVIFTHDVAFYNVTMPGAVHVDSNGFSDWTPMSTVDTALMTQSEANSSHHEYVWVFHTNRGAFDPAKFSSRRKPLFSKGETNMLGSHGGYKTVMDALTYIESNATTR